MNRSVLYVNACVRKDSRTQRLAEKLLSRLDRPYQEIKLEEIRFPVCDEEYLNRRDRLVKEGDLQNPMLHFAKQFSEADIIVIAAPYWDLSFPAMLKQYLEQVNVVGITFKYSEEGVPIGLCKAKKIYYVTTAGGHFVPEEYGFGYVKALAQNYYGISDIRKIETVGLDIYGADVDVIMKEAETNVADMEL